MRAFAVAFALLSALAALSSAATIEKRTPVVAEDVFRPRQATRAQIVESELEKRKSKPAKAQHSSTACKHGKLNSNYNCRPRDQRGHHLASACVNKHGELTCVYQARRAANEQCHYFKWGSLKAHASNHKCPHGAVHHKSCLPKC